MLKWSLYKMQSLDLKTPSHTHRHTQTQTQKTELQKKTRYPDITLSGWEIKYKDVKVGFSEAPP